MSAQELTAHRSASAAWPIGLARRAEPRTPSAGQSPQNGTGVRAPELATTGVCDSQ
jgi:hypothetical protein